MLVMIVIDFWWNCSKILYRLFIKLGLFNSILLRDSLLYFVDELNIFLILFFFCGWYILNRGKY